MPYHRYAELHMDYEFLKSQNAELRALTQHGEPGRLQLVDQCLSVGSTLGRMLGSV